MSGGEQLLILVVVLGLFWVLMMRPARNQRRQMQNLQKNLAVGDQVVISAGIFGTVRSVEDQKVDLEIAPGTVITVASQVVVRRATEAEGAGDEADDAEDLDDGMDDMDDEDEAREDDSGVGEAREMEDLEDAGDPEATGSVDAEESAEETARRRTAGEES